MRRWSQVLSRLIPAFELRLQLLSLHLGVTFKATLVSIVCLLQFKRRDSRRGDLSGQRSVISEACHDITLPLCVLPSQCKFSYVGGYTKFGDETTQDKVDHRDQVSCMLPLATSGLRTSI